MSENEKETKENKESRTDKVKDLGDHLRDLFESGGGGISFGPVAGPEAHAAAEAAAAEEQQNRAELMDKILKFDLKPREIRDHLDRFVISQDEAKKVLSVAICDHYNHVRRCLENPRIAEQDLAKHNVLLVGPTGVGKTYLMRCAAKLIGVPFVKADATKFTETGYVGYDVEDLVRDLVRVAGDDPDVAAFGIVYIDEIDKLASRGTTSGMRDVGGRGVQVNLLKMMEDTEIKLVGQTDMMAQMKAMMSMQATGEEPRQTMRSRHILFIVSGAFGGLGEQIKRRLGDRQIGFGNASSENNEDEEQQYLRQMETRDLVDYGFEPEFAGRLPVRVSLEALSVDDLEEILTSAEDSVLNQYITDFQGYGIEIDIRPDALREIALRAHEEKTGARGLMTVMERLFRDFKFELPSTLIDKFVVTAETVREPEKALKQLLSENQHAMEDVRRQEVAAFSQRFLEEYGFNLEFTPEAVDAVLAKAEENGKTVRGFCEERFRDYEFGLKLLDEQVAKRVLTISGEAIDDPDAYLSKLIKKMHASLPIADADEV